MYIKTGINKSTNFLDGDAIVDFSYKVMLPILDIYPGDKDRLEGWVIGGRNHADKYFGLPDISAALLDGIYIPGTERQYWLGTFDTHVDALPESGSVIIDDGSKALVKYCNIKKIDHIPTGVWDSKKNGVAASYEVSIVEIHDKKDFLLMYRPKEKDDDIRHHVFTCEKSYFQVMQDGRINAVIDTSRHKKERIYNDVWCGAIWGAGALTLTADRKYLWNVQIAEELNRGVKAKLNFGVKEDHIRSLFISRDAPMTKAGRRNPILHWVNAHKRLSKSDELYDVRKHLRGHEEFDMGGFHFKITEPVKELKH